jgi:hypothetical protein
MATPTEEARESDHMPAFPAGDDEQIMAPHLREDAEVVALTALASRYAPFDPLVALRLFRAELCAGDRVELPALLESLAAIAPRLVDAGDPVLRTLCDGSAVAAFLRRRAPADPDGAQRVDYALWQQLVWRCVDEALPELRRRALLHGQCYWGLGRNVRTGSASRVVRTSMHKQRSLSSAGAFQEDWDDRCARCGACGARAVQALDARCVRVAGAPTAVWKSTARLGRPDQTSELSSSVKSMSIRLIFGRIDGSRRVLEARRKNSRRNGRIRAH